MCKPSFLLMVPIQNLRGAWMTQSVKYPLTLDFGSGHDLTLTAGSLLGILFPSLSASPHPSKLTKETKKKKKEFENIIMKNSFLLLIWERERERENVEKGRGRERILSRLLEPHAGLDPTTWDHNLSQNQESDTQLPEPPRYPEKFFTRNLV